MVWRGTRGPAPPARAWHGMAYDVRRRRTIVFGGIVDRPAMDRGWEWDGRAWQPLGVASGPRSRVGPAMVYDAAREAVVLFGGYAGGEYLSDTWTLALRELEPQVVSANMTLEVFLGAAGDAAIEAAEPLPADAELRDGRLRWTPRAADAGRHEIRLQATSGDASSFSTLIVEVEVPPYLRLLGSRRIAADTEQTMTTVVVIDTNLPPETVSLDALDLPDGAQFDPATRTLVWQPTRAQTGSHRIRFEARSGELHAIGQTTIEVTHRVRPPEEVLAEVWAKGGFHGFRLGYQYVMADQRLPSPHRFLMGYDLGYRFDGGGPLDLVLLGGLGFTGLEQSALRSDFSVGLHFEIQDHIRLGTSILVPFQRSWQSRLALSVGWTATAGAFDVPLEIRFIPDPEGRHTSGVHVGVWW
jgi:hypothetical protein